MEKIYMDNNKKQSTFQQIFKSQLSKKLTISMVLVSFFSFLVIGLGSGNISYAAPDTIPESDLGDSFQTADPTGVVIYGSNGAAGSLYPIQMYSTSTGIPIFCLERDIGFRGGVTLNKSEQITDQGLLYVMANSSPHVTFKDSSGNEFEDEVQTWITQAAIWEYLYQTGAADNSNITTDQTTGNLDNMRGATRIYWQDGSDYHVCDVNGCYTSDTQATSTATFYETYISPLVENAKNTTSANGQMQISKANNEISMTDDEKYYQTSLITVSNTAPNNIAHFTVRIDGAPDGTVLVDENGQVVEDTTNLERFYVRVPVDKVTEETKDIQIAVEGTFRGYDGYYYRGTDAQTVSTVFTVDTTHSAYIPISIDYTPEVPDTGMSLAQSVYFVGLIVLLCGVGIIYANTKPRERQQQ